MRRSAHDSPFICPILKENHTYDPKSPYAEIKLTMNLLQIIKSKIENNYQLKNETTEVFIFRGLKRSGNHGIINWISAHKNIYFCNNVIPIAGILLGKRKMPKPCDFNKWSKQNHNGDCPILISLEDHTLDVEYFKNIHCKTTNILLIRDPYNLFASRIKKGFQIKRLTVYPRTMDNYMERIVLLWKNYAKEFLEDTNQLSNKACIYFNDWFTSVQYRQTLSKTLNLSPFVDTGFYKVSNAEGGSSFDGVNYDGYSGNMDVLNRHLQLSSNEQSLFEQILQDSEIESLANRISQLSNNTSGTPNTK